MTTLIACSSSEDPGPVTPPDTRVPRSVADLRVTAGSDASVTLAWTTPGLLDKADPQIRYDLRHTPLGTEDRSWDNWTVNTAPTPSTAVGQARLFVVRNLTAGSTHVFRLLASTDGVEWSAASNSAVGTAAAKFDKTPPAPITDLHHRSGDDTSVLVAWAAAGNDSIYGLADGYQVRYATQPIDVVNWVDATPVAEAVGPVAGARSVGVEITGLDPDTDYFVAAKAYDADNNLSGLSNVLQVSPGAKRTLYVNAEGTGDYPIIQAAIDAAGPGDLILVGPGRYTFTTQGTNQPRLGMINFHSNFTPAFTDFELRSELGAAVTILDAEEQAPIMTVAGGNFEYPDGTAGTTGYVIDGFTFTGGKAVSEEGGPAGAGAGISLHITDSVIRNCIFVDNEALEGGALWIGGQGAAVIEDCVIENNRAIVGGGLVLVNSAPRITLRSCTIRGNRATKRGGGIIIYNAEHTIEDCLITGNNALEEGGGIYFANLKPDSEVIGTTIADNDQPHRGGRPGLGTGHAEADAVPAGLQHGLGRDQHAFPGGCGDGVHQRVRQ